MSQFFIKDKNTAAILHAFHKSFFLLQFLKVVNNFPYFHQATSVNKIYILWLTRSKLALLTENHHITRISRKIKIHGIVLWQTKEVIWSQAIAMHISAQEIDSLISDNNNFCHSRELYC